MNKVIWPYGISLKLWADSLVSDFGEECLPKLEDEKQWQDWGSQVAGTGIFLRASVPPPVTYTKGVKNEVFKEWDKWAKTVFRIMSDDYSSTDLNLTR